MTELLSTAAHALLLVHFAACIMWFAVRIQGFPPGTVHTSFRTVQYIPDCLVARLNVQAMVCWAHALDSTDNPLICMRLSPGTWPVQLGIVSSSTGTQYLWSLFSAASVMIGLGYGAYPPVTWPEVRILTVSQLWMVVFWLKAWVSMEPSRSWTKQPKESLHTATGSGLAYVDHHHCSVVGENQLVGLLSLVC